MLDTYGNRVTAGNKDVTVVARLKASPYTEFTPSVGATAVSKLGVATFSSLVIDAPMGTYNLFVTSITDHVGAVTQSFTRMARSAVSTVPANAPEMTKAISL